MPSRELPRRAKEYSCASCPILSGIVPFIMLNYRSRTCKYDRFPIIVGSGPKSAFWLILRVFKYWREPKESGSNPLTLLKPTSNNFKLLLLHLDKPSISSSISILTELNDRSKIYKLQWLFFHEICEVEPVNPELERSTVTRVLILKSHWGNEVLK